MNNFRYSIPTVVYFGRDQLCHLAELRQSGSRVLLVYGGGSIKRSGLYDAAMKILSDAGLSVTELSERVGITMANISILKNGKAKAIKIQTLDKICEALDCEPGDILEYRKG